MNLFGKYFIFDAYTAGLPTFSDAQLKTFREPCMGIGYRRSAKRVSSSCAGLFICLCFISTILHNGTKTTPEDIIPGCNGTTHQYKPLAAVTKVSITHTRSEATHSPVNPKRYTVTDPTQVGEEVKKFSPISILNNGGLGETLFFPHLNQFIHLCMSIFDLHVFNLILI